MVLFSINFPFIGFNSKIYLFKNKMKKLLYIIISLLAVACGIEHERIIIIPTDSLDSNKLTIFINYKQKVGDYVVIVKCLVDTVGGENTLSGYNLPKTDNAVRGESTLYFKSETDSFEVKVGDFTDYVLYNNKMPLKDGMIIVADYTPYNISSIQEEMLLETNSPFFFFDIDYDGEKELFINSFDTFIKGHSMYTIYKPSENRILSEEPYLAISDYVRIDTVNKQLHLPYVNAGEMCTAPGYISYKVEREMKYDSNIRNLSVKNIYKPYRIEVWQKDNIYGIYEVIGDTLLFKETIDKAK